VGSLSNSGTSYVTGYTGNALQLSTTGAYFQVLSLTELGISNQAFSVAIRVKPTAVSGPLVHVSSAASGECVCYIFVFVRLSTIEFCILLKD
jgi:hypothetical protein